MRGYIARFVPIVLALALSGAGQASVLAQSESKTPTSTGEKTSWVGTPPPEDCHAEPMTGRNLIDSLTKVNAIPADPEALPLTLASETDLPTGTSVEPEIIAAVSETLWEATACLNAGDFARFLALFSPAGLYQFFTGLLGAMGRAPGPLTEEELAEFETNVSTSLADAPTPIPKEEQARINKIRDARTLPDKRVLVVVDGSIGGEASAFAVLRKVEDRWLIDAIGQVGETAPATDQ